MGKYQPIKFRKDQYIYLRNLIRKEFGNISIPRGIYIVTYLYLKYVPKDVKEVFKKKYGNKGRTRKTI